MVLSPRRLPPVVQSSKLWDKAKPISSQQLLDCLDAAAGYDCVRDIDDAIDEADNIFVLFPDHKSPQLCLLLTAARARRDELLRWNQGVPTLALRFQDMAAHGVC